MMLLIALFACKAELSLAETQPSPVGPSTGTVQSYQLVAWPGRTTESDGSVRAFPRRIRDIPLDSLLDIDFKRPVRLEGSVFGLRATPRPRAQLPGTLGPIDATIAFRRDESLEDQLVHTDEQGLYEAWLVPGAQEVVVRPDSALVPPLEFSIDVDAEGAPLDFDLREFLPVWGRITEDGAAKQNAQVRLVFSDGSVGPIAITDDDGWYELRVSHGAVVGIECLGAGDGIDPVLRTAEQLIGPQGLRTDFDYADLPLHTLTGRLLTDQGAPISQVPYTLVSTALSDYPSGEVTRSGFTDTSGHLTVRALPGEYELTLLMERDSNRTSRRLNIDLNGPLDLASIEVGPLRRLSGRVGDITDTPLPNALVSCSELDFARRSWSTVTDDLGQYEIDVSNTAVSCSAVADSRTDLAGTRTRIDPDHTEQDFVLGGGRLVEGTLTHEGTPEEFALVEVLGSDGLIWATALSDDRGRYQLRIQPDTE